MRTHTHTHTHTQTDYRMPVEGVATHAHRGIIRCTRDSGELFDIRGLDPRVTREVIRLRYMGNPVPTQPDMTRVTVRPDPQPRVQGATYNCTVTVEGRTGIDSGNYTISTLGSGSSTVTVTGE